MDNQPSFFERAHALKDLAYQLKAGADIVLQEAQRMESAQVLFKERMDRPPRLRLARLVNAQSPCWGDLARAPYKLLVSRRMKCICIQCGKRARDQES